MTRLFFSSLRVRLLFLVLLAVIPAFGVILYTGLEERRRLLRRSGDRTAGSAPGVSRGLEQHEEPVLSSY